MAITLCKKILNFCINSFVVDDKTATNFHVSCFKKVTPSQIREAEKNLKIMESMINVMTPGRYFQWD